MVRVRGQMRRQMVAHVRFPRVEPFGQARVGVPALVRAHRLPGAYERGRDHVVQWCAARARRGHRFRRGWVP